MTLKKTVLMSIFIGIMSGMMLIQAGDDKGNAMLNDAIQKMKGGKMTEAEPLFKKVLEKEHFNLLAAMNLGVCYMKMKKPELAEQAFTYATQLAVNEIQPYIFLGQLYLQKGDKNQAALALRKAFDLDPNSPACGNLAPHLGWKRVGSQWLSPAEKAMLDKAPDTVFGFKPGEKRIYHHHYQTGGTKKWKSQESIQYAGKRIAQGMVAHRFLCGVDYEAKKRMADMTVLSTDPGAELYQSYIGRCVLDVTSEGFPLHYEGELTQQLEHYQFGGSFCYDFKPDGIVYADHTNNVTTLAADYRFIRNFKFSELDKVLMADWYLRGVKKEALPPVFKQRKGLFLDDLPLLRNIPLYFFLKSGADKQKYTQSKIMFPNYGENTYRIDRDILTSIEKFGKYNVAVSYLVGFEPPICQFRDFDFSRSKDTLKIHGKKIDCFRVKTDFYSPIDFWITAEGKILKIRYPTPDEELWIAEENL